MKWSKHEPDGWLQITHSPILLLFHIKRWLWLWLNWLPAPSLVPRVVHWPPALWAVLEVVGRTSPAVDWFFVHFARCVTDDESLSVCLAFSQFLCGSGTRERPSSESPECYSGPRVPQPFGARLPLNTDRTLRIRNRKTKMKLNTVWGQLLCVHLVHKKGGDGTRVGLIVQPEQFSSVRLSLRARPALVPLVSLSTAPRLGAIWKTGPQMHTEEPRREQFCDWGWAKGQSHSRRHRGWYTWRSGRRGRLAVVAFLLRCSSLACFTSLS